jgi:hypothetical protein
MTMNYFDDVSHSILCHIVSGTMSLYAASFENYLPDIPDPSVFHVPAICKHALRVNIATNNSILYNLFLDRITECFCCLIWQLYIALLNYFLSSIMSTQIVTDNIHFPPYRNKKKDEFKLIENFFYRTTNSLKNHCTKRCSGEKCLPNIDLISISTGMTGQFECHKL